MSKLEPGEVPCEKAENPRPRTEQRTEYVPGAEETHSQALRAHREAAQREAQGPADQGQTGGSVLGSNACTRNPRDLTTNPNPQEREHAQPCGPSESAGGARARRRGNSSKGNWLGVNRAHAAYAQHQALSCWLGASAETWICLPCSPWSLPLRHCGPDLPTS